MLFDTDVLIWVLRGHCGAAELVEKSAERRLSIVTYMELLQGARDRREVKIIKGFLTDMAFQMAPLAENIGHRAAIYMEEYGLKASMAMADALIAATAVEAQWILCTGNRKHYRPIADLDLHIFRP
jgi:predicted nucleic acid-binding protein